MSIDKDEIEKYIFDPKNPKQCKSYNLLLNIAKKENLVYVDSDFLLPLYESQIINENFDNELWDKPNNYDSLDINKKVDLYIKSLSRKEYIEHLNTLNFNLNNLQYYKLFSRFFDYHLIYDYITNIVPRYPNELIKKKLSRVDNYSFTGYKKFKDDNYSMMKTYEGSKILFTNNFGILTKDDNFFDVSSINILLLEKKEHYLNYNNLNCHIKPLFLKDMKDLKLLLDVLESDLKQTKKNDAKQEDISFIKSIDVKDLFSIKDLKIDNLEDKKEIYIVGENGDGKTLLLQAITIACKGIEKDGQEVFREIKDDFTINLIDSNDNIYDGKNAEYKNIFAYGANRNNNCQLKEDDTGYLTLFDKSLDLINPVEWLIKIDNIERYNKEREEETFLTKDKVIKILLEILNKDIEIEVTPTTVIFTEKGSPVDYRQLSAGYQGVITIVCDMLERLHQNQPDIKKIEEYKAITIIDEVELHLHPKWKYNFMTKLREIFPLVQFIVTTHSPTVILGASKEAVFYKIYKENGEVSISNQIQNEGYTNNSLVSSPLFDLETVTSRDYDKKVSSDDYIYEKIHKVVAQRIEENININEDDILKLIDAELENYDKDK